MMTISDESTNCSNSSVITVDDTQCLVKFYEKNEDYRDADTDYEGRESLNRKINFHIGNITDFKADAIVCSTQTDLTFVPYGIHKQVTRQAGVRYEESCKQVGKCEAGKAFITQGYRLPAKYIIHTAGPSPDTTLSYNERKQCLKDSYTSCLKIVKTSQDIRTVVFPCLGSGGAGLQLNDAIRTAVTTIREWLETDNNIIHVDSIILVMYDENQWNEYYMELFKTFPYGKDLAGIDLESLDFVDERTLAGFTTQTPIPYFSNILCFKYKKSAAKHVNRHFHSLANTIHNKVCTRNGPLDRHRNCATFLVTIPHEHRIVLYQGQESLTLEVQIISYHDNPDNLDQTLCEDVQTFINDYLLRNLENVTRFKTYIRCNTSNWGDVDGMVSVKRFKTRLPKHSTKQCRHRKSGNTQAHTVDINEMAKFWISHNQESLSSYHPEASEHDEVTGESEDSISWPSLASLSSFGSDRNMAHKQDNIPTNTEGSDQIPVEHSEESDENTIKFQVLSKSNKNSDDEKSLAPNYQQFDDSLLESYPKTQSWMTTKGKDLNIEFPSNHQKTRDSMKESHLLKGKGQNQTGSGPNLDDLGAYGGTGFSYSQQPYNSFSIDMTSLNDKALLNIARIIGNRETQLGLELNLSYACIQRIKAENAGDAIMQAFCILREWRIKRRGKCSIDMLIDAMANCSIDTSFLMTL